MEGTIYFDIRVDTGVVHITESSEKPAGCHSAVVTLGTIANILEHSPKVPNQSRELLRDIAADIFVRYGKGLRQKIWVVRKLFSEEERVRNIYGRIEILFAYRDELPLGDLPLKKVCTWLPPDALIAFAGVSRVMRERVTGYVIGRAKTLGYKGEDRTEAGRYLNNRLKEIRNANSSKQAEREALVGFDIYSPWGGGQSLDPWEALASTSR